ncbi:hypothetical protein GGQ85_003678 [Nitrobacter vulgaris]|uniref:hypothetical protein n=1 Tax=Nitrobacter vulgaris TaxID=29421 RepID=UPI00285AD614|nr:hypothetical protein [Nitrobacter vulgaris]MDR6305951.1 hypothetical protein [Nitrobacter vulgaris]
MYIEPEIGGCGIVLVGHFNPLILTPLWLAKNTAVSEQEAEAAEISVIHPEIAAFKVGKLRIQVETHRFSVDSIEAPWIDVCDFVGLVFGDLLSHTPINQMGINRSVHFNVGSEAVRNAIGRLLAPIEPWGEWGQELANSPSDARAGCTNLTMSQPKIQAGQSAGHIQVQVQPSARIRGKGGIFVLVNDHFEFGSLENTVGCESAISCLTSEFENSIRNSESKIELVMRMKDKV